MRYCPSFPTPMFPIYFFVALMAFTLILFIPGFSGSTSREYERSNGDTDLVLNLLPEMERRVLEYIVKKGEEIPQAQITRDLGLNKVKVWRIIQRLQSKGLVETRKVKGRVLVKAKIDF